MSNALIFLVLLLTPSFLLFLQLTFCSFPLLDFTNEWPIGVTNGAASTGIPSGMDLSIGDSNISELVAEIKPR